jgi:hypothetical protein
MSDVDTLPAPDFVRKHDPYPEWEEERRAFVRLLPTLLPTHRGMYVAIHKAAVIAEGPDQIDVAKRAYAQAGYIPIYVGLVTDQPPEPVRLPFPRLLPGRPH